MNLLNKLTIKNLKLNKKRSIVTIIGITLSVALIMAVANLYESFLASLIDFEIQRTGNFQIAYYNMPADEISNLKNNRGIEELYLAKSIGYAKIEGIQNEFKPYANIKAFSKNAMENLSFRLVEGEMPKNNDEIVIPTHLKTNGRIEFKVGDTITLDVGIRAIDNNPIENQESVFLEGEQIINTTAKTFKIVGIVERPDSNIEEYILPGYTFATCVDENDFAADADVYARYTSEGIKNCYEITGNILGINPDAIRKYFSGDFDSQEQMEEYTNIITNAKYRIDCNHYLITLQSNPLKDPTMESMCKIVIVVCVIIIFTSVFCIKNSFEISISEKIKQYGMLKSVGATKKQIKKNVLFEGTILGTIGIPLGLLGGSIASVILLKITNELLSGSFANDYKLIHVFSYKAFLVAILLGAVTIYFSSIKSARKAGKVSPIESIRNSGDIKIKSKKVKSPKIISKIFGIGGTISYKNLKRNKKKYRTTVISTTVSVILFISMYAVINLAFSEVEQEINYTEYNLSVDAFIQEKEDYKTIMKIEDLDNIEEYVAVRTDYFEVDGLNINKEFAKTNNVNLSEIEGTINIYTLGDEPYKKYIKQLGFNYEEVKDKAIFVNGSDAVYNNKLTSEVFYISNSGKMYDYKKGDIIKGNIYGEKYKEIEIAYETKKVPFGFNNDATDKIFVSDEWFDNNSETGSVYFMIKSNNPNKLQDDIEGLLKGIECVINNIDEQVKIMNNIYLLFAIFLYGFIIVISLIGITNVFNTITTSMELRKQEFAMLKSIGMTKKEFSRMIRLESIFIGSKSLIIGIPIGVGISYFMYHLLGEGSAVKFKLPIFAIVVSIAVVFLLIMCIMKYSMSKINKQNTIETIRNENI